MLWSPGLPRIKEMNQHHLYMESTTCTEPFYVTAVCTGACQFRHHAYLPFVARSSAFVWVKHEIVCLWNGSHDCMCCEDAQA